MGGALASVGKFKLGVVAATAAVAALAVALTVSSVKAAAAFEQGMARVRAVTGAVGQDWTALQNKAKELGKATKFSMVEIAGGMEALGRAGFKTTELISAMGGVTALASSQMMSLAEAGQITANILRSMQLPVMETDRVVNLLAATAASSNTTVQSLGESFKMIASLASQLGTPVEELASIIGKLGDVGFQGTMATSTLATAMVRLASPSADAEAIMKQLNISLWDAQGNFIGLTNMVALLEDRFKGLTQQQQQAALGAIFGARAVKQLNALISIGADKLRDYTSEITDTTAAFDQQKNMLDTLSGKWVILQSSIEALKTSLGDNLLPALKDYVDYMIIVVNTTTDWVSGNATLLESLQKVHEALATYYGVPQMFYPDKALTDTENEIKRVQEAIALLTRLFGEDNKEVKILNERLKELQKTADQEGVVTLSDAALAAAVAFKQAQAALSGLNGEVGKAGGLAAGLSDLSVAGSTAFGGMSFGGIPPSVTLVVNSGNVPEVFKTLEETLASLTIAMSADGIYKGLQALATTYPDSIDEIVAKGNSLVDGMRTRAASLRALAGENQDMITSAVALEGQADILSSALGLTEGAAGSLTGALDAAAAAARTLASAANAMAMSQVTDIIPQVNQMIAELKAGTKPIEITLPAGEAGGGTVTGTGALTIGEAAEKAFQVTAVQSVVGGLRDTLYDLGINVEELFPGLESTRGYFDALSIQRPEEILADQERARKEAESNAKKAASDAATAAKKAASDAVRAAAEAAQGARDTFQAGFTSPVLAALKSGDWKGALDAIQGFAQGRGGLIAQGQALAAVNGETLNQVDILQMITGSYQSLGSALDSQIAVMKLAFEDTTALEDFKVALEAAAAGAPTALQMIKSTDILSAPAETARKLAALAGQDAVSVSEYTTKLISSIQAEIDARKMFGMDTKEAQDALAEFSNELAEFSLSDVWGPLKSVLGNVTGKFGTFLSGITDLAQKFSETGASIANIGDAVAFAVNMIIGFVEDLLIGPLEDKIEGFRDQIEDLNEQIEGFREQIQELNEQIQGYRDQIQEAQEQLQEFNKQLQELEKTFTVYTSAVEGAASVMNNFLGLLGPLGSVLSATATAFTSALKMILLDGIDLLNAGISMLTNYLNSLISAVIGLIQKSDAYQAVQTQGSRAWKAIADLFGQFLWPLAALLKHIMDWLGIQDDVNEAASAVEIGVPSSWKREGRAYEAAAPGEVFTDATDGTDIPAWATAIVEGIAEAIEGVLEQFGISSWTDLLEKFKAGSIKFWNYVETEIPALVTSLTSIFTTISTALGTDPIGALTDWLERKFDWLLTDGPTAVQGIIDFTEDMAALKKTVTDWLADITWEKLKQQIEDSFADFGTTLADLPAFADIETAVDGVTTAIDGLNTTIEGYEDDIAAATAAIEGIETNIDATTTAIGLVEDAIDDTTAEIDRLKEAMKHVIAIAAGAIIGGFIAALAASRPLLSPVILGVGALGMLIGGGLAGLISGAFAEGGIIPGPIGSPQLVVGHGGEAVLTRAQQAQGSQVYNEVRVYIGDEEVTDLVVNRVQHRSKLTTGSKHTSAGLTGRYR